MRHNKRLAQRYGVETHSSTAAGREYRTDIDFMRWTRLFVTSIFYFFCLSSLHASGVGLSWLGLAWHRKEDESYCQTRHVLHDDFGLVITPWRFDRRQECVLLAGFIRRNTMYVRSVTV